MAAFINFSWLIPLYCSLLPLPISQSWDGAAVSRHVPWLEPPSYSRMGVTEEEQLEHGQRPRRAPPSIPPLAGLSAESPAPQSMSDAQHTMETHPPSTPVTTTVELPNDVLQGFDSSSTIALTLLAQGGSTTSGELNAGTTFSPPPGQLSNSEMLEKAKSFARRFLSPSELESLRQRVAETKRTGASTAQIRQTVLRFLSRVLDVKRKAAIEAEKEQLWRDFGEDITPTLSMHAN